MSDNLDKGIGYNIVDATEGAAWQVTMTVSNQYTGEGEDVRVTHPALKVDCGEGQWFTVDVTRDDLLALADTFAHAAAAMES